MKFSIKVGDLLTAVDKVSGTVDKKEAALFLNVYKTEKSSAVFIYATNMCAESTVKMDAVVEEAGQTLLDPAQLRAALMNRSADDSAEISLVTSGAKAKEKTSRIRIKIGKNVVHLGYDPTGSDVMAGRMTAIPFRQQANYTIPGKNLAEFVRRAAFCIPKDNEGVNRFEMSGMKLISTDAGYEAHATDGHICAKIVVKGEKGPQEMEGILIPQIALLPLSRLVKKEEQIQVIEGPRNDRNMISKLFFKLGTNTFFGTRLLHGRYPDVESAIKSHAPDYWFKVSREVLKQTLERVASFDEAGMLQLEVVGDVLKLSAKGTTADIAEELAIEREDGTPADIDVKITIDLIYLKNVTSGSSQDNLRIGVSDYNNKTKATMAMVVDDHDDNIESMYVIMPKRV